jgi:hypothetical protein
MLSRGHIRPDTHAMRAPADLGQRHRMLDLHSLNALSFVSGQEVVAFAKTDPPLASLPPAIEHSPLPAHRRRGFCI